MCESLYRALPQTLAQLLQLACIPWGRHPKADLTLPEWPDLLYVNPPCLGASTFLHTWTLRALHAEPAQPHNPEVRELNPSLLYPEYSNQQSTG